MKKLLTAAAVGTIVALTIGSPVYATNGEKGKDRTDEFRRKTPENICTVSGLKYNDTKNLTLANGATAETTDKGLQLHTPIKDDHSAKLQWKVTLPTAVGLNKLSSAGYVLTKVDTAGPGVNDAALLSYDIFVDKNGDGTEDFTLVYEPYYNTAGNPARNTPKLWDVTTGKFWANKADAWPGNVVAGSYASNKTIPQISALYPNAKITGYGYHQGTYNDGATSLLAVYWFDTNDTVKEGYGWTAWCNTPKVEFKDTCVGTTVIMTNSVAYLTTEFQINNTKYQVGTSKVVEDVVGETVEVRYAKFKKATHTWVKPQSCASPSPSTSVTASVSPGPTAGGSLPVTGSKTWVLVGTGTLAIAMGIAALIVARSRKTAFYTE